VEERILSIEQAAKETPWGASTLYRWAPEPDSPFTKLKGRWVTTLSALARAVEEGEKPAIRQPIQDPMPRRRRTSGCSVLAEVEAIERRAA
jgi:hypothetical protein